MTGNELYELLKTGKTVKCVVNKNIFEEIIYADTGMIVDVTLIKEGGDDTFEILLDGTPYVEHNHTLALADYYDKAGNPCLRYFETWYFKDEKETLFVDITDRYDCGLDLYELPMSFEEWWKKTYFGKLGGITIELAFKEVAEKAWNAKP